MYKLYNKMYKLYNKMYKLYYKMYKLYYKMYKLYYNHYLPVRSFEKHGVSIFTGQFIKMSKDSVSSFHLI